LTLNFKKQWGVEFRIYNDGVAYLNSHTVADIQDILVKDLMFPENIAVQVTLPEYTNAQPVNANDKDILQVIGWLNRNKTLDSSFTADNLVNDQLTK